MKKNWTIRLLAGVAAGAMAFSMVADFTKLPETVALARDGKQIQPIFG